jgi:hypothetical protein
LTAKEVTPEDQQAIRKYWQKKNAERKAYFAEYHRQNLAKHKAFQKAYREKQDRIAEEMAKARANAEKPEKPEKPEKR